MNTTTTDCEYANNGERITAPGKFEGEPIFAPHYWGLALEGFADDDGTVFKFKFTAEELSQPANAVLKAWLGRRRTLRLSEDGNGFVRCF